MQVCSKCGEVLVNNYAQCPYCNAPIADNAPESEDIEEKRKQYKKELEKAYKAAEDHYLKYRELSNICFIIYLISIPIAALFVWMGGTLLAAKIAIGIFICGFIVCCVGIYFAYGKGGRRCPYCNSFFGRGGPLTYCARCGKKLPPK